MPRDVKRRDLRPVDGEAIAIKSLAKRTRPEAIKSADLLANPPMNEDGAREEVIYALE
jgi:hypothetical protein